MKSMSLHKKMKFSTKDFFSKCDQIRRKLRIWSLLLKKSLMENFIFLCGVSKRFKRLTSDFEIASMLPELPVLPEHMLQLPEDGRPDLLLDLLKGVFFDGVVCSFLLWLGVTTTLLFCIVPARRKI